VGLLEETFFSALGRWGFRAGISEGIMNVLLGEFLYQKWSQENLTWCLFAKGSLVPIMGRHSQSPLQRENQVRREAVN